MIDTTFIRVSNTVVVDCRPLIQVKWNRLAGKVPPVRLRLPVADRLAGEIIQKRHGKCPLSVSSESENERVCKIGCPGQSMIALWFEGGSIEGVVF